MVPLFAAANTPSAQIFLRALRCLQIQQSNENNPIRHCKVMSLIFSFYTENWNQFLRMISFLVLEANLKLQVITSEFY
jgi:hypothetical protein